MAGEPLISVIRQQVTETMGYDDVAVACLFRLADRGVYTLRELPEVAYQLRKRYGDGLTGMSAITDVTVNQFATAAGLPAVKGGRT